MSNDEVEVAGPGGTAARCCKSVSDVTRDCLPPYESGGRLPGEKFEAIGR